MEEEALALSDDEEKEEKQEEQDMLKQTQEQKINGVREVFKKNIKKFIHNIHSECQELTEEQKKELYKDPNSFPEPEKILEMHDDSKCCLIEPAALDLFTEKVIQFLQNLIHKTYKRSIRRDPTNDIILDSDMLYVLQEDPQFMNKVCHSMIIIKQREAYKLAENENKKVGLKQIQEYGEIKIEKTD